MEKYRAKSEEAFIVPAARPPRILTQDDILAMFGYFLEQYSDRVDVKGIDTFLASNGAPKLTSLLMSSKKRVRTIIKTGKIKNDEDYYLLKEILSDVESTLITEDDRSKAESILTAREIAEEDRRSHNPALHRIANKPGSR